MHVGIVGRPPREPRRTEAAGLRRLQQGEADAAGGQQPLLRRDLLVVGIQDRHDDHHQRSPAETASVLLQRGRRGLRIPGEHEFDQRFAEDVPRIALDADETERFAFAVVGHPYRGLQHAQQRVLVRRRGPEELGGDRAAFIQGGEGHGGGLGAGAMRVTESTGGDGQRTWCH